MNRRKSLHLFSEFEHLGISNSDFFALTALTLLYAIFEGAGISLLLPVLEYIENGLAAAQRGIGKVVLSLLNHFHVDPSARTFVPALLLIAIVAFILRSAFQYARDIQAAKLKSRIAIKIREKAAAAFVHTGFPFLHAHDKGELSSALTTDAERATEALAARAVFLNALSLVAIYALLLFLFAPLLAVFALPIFLLGGFIVRWQSRKSGELSEVVSQKHVLFASQIDDELDGMIRVKMRGYEKQTGEKLITTTRQIMQEIFKIEKLRVLVETGLHPLFILAAFLVMYIAIAHLHMTLAGLGIFLFIMLRLGPQLILLNSMWIHMHACTASLHRINGLIEEAVCLSEKQKSTLPFIRLSSGITFENVCFQYPGKEGHEYALKNISIELKSRGIHAIVGRSGAGKSTLLKMLMNLYQPDSGQVYFDRVPVTDYDLRSIRTRIAFVPQEAFLFNDTIRKNILYGLEREITDSELNRILTLSYCNSFVDKLTQGLDTFVGERGVRLSQGEKQRIALAHALAIDPEILILDEPMTSLDAESENAIHDSIFHKREDVTVIVIAHRFSTISGADQILLMDHGEIRSRGNHRTLIESDLLYKKLFELQMLD
ncbi:MAG: hypothetical protein C5B54_11175 [Acidobacteria bacterium]|nr:MAG: hypothetical protein C5B54_11175 [Acidobacteriota bacterium]